MALDYRSELRRPVTLGLLALAAVGWLITVVLLSSRAEDQRDHRRQVRTLQASEAEVRGQLA